jgi:putative beta-lysine N-acetyltransferase
MKLSAADFPAVIGYMERLSEENGYTKIFAKLPAWAWEAFHDAGYETEAVVPNFFAGRDDAFFMSRFLTPARKQQENKEEAERVLARAQDTPPMERPAALPETFRHAMLAPENAEELSALYRTVFQTYPFPVFDPAYVLETMRENLLYFGIRDGEKLVAVSSCEMDRDAANVEMTDFATLPEVRGKGLASFLLLQMEREMVRWNIRTAYTIARSVSFGMNITFAKHRYQYAGTLVNNTDISGSIESMNVWYKKLS